MCVHPSELLEEACQHSNLLETALLRGVMNEDVLLMLDTRWFDW